VDEPDPISDDLRHNII